MIDDIVHWWKIDHLQRELKATRQFYLSKLRAAKELVEKEEISSEASYEEGMLTDKIDWLWHRRLDDLARRHGVPVPNFETGESGPYVKSEYNGRYRLKRPELHKLRTAIRAERKEIFESWSRWVALVLPTVSLVISIVALLKK